LTDADVEVAVEFTGPDTVGANLVWLLEHGDPRGGRRDRDRVGQTSRARRRSPPTVPPTR
jgi:hypothetical protein